jgi:hypothetical protein
MQLRGWLRVRSSGRLGHNLVGGIVGVEESAQRRVVGSGGEVVDEGGEMDGLGSVHVE